MQSPGLRHFGGIQWLLPLIQGTPNPNLACVGLSALPGACCRPFRLGLCDIAFWESLSKGMVFIEIWFFKRFFSSRHLQNITPNLGCNLILDGPDFWHSHPFCWGKVNNCNSVFKQGLPVILSCNALYEWSKLRLLLVMWWIIAPFAFLHGVPELWGWRWFQYNLVTDSLTRNRRRVLA